MGESATPRAWDHWQQSAAALAHRFDAALEVPAAAQAEYLADILRRAQGTAWAETCGMDAATRVADFRRRAPVTTAEDLATWTGPIARGKPNILTRDTVERLVPTSGTTGTSKWIPMTPSSRREYARAVDLWITECLRIAPSMRAGRAYIATSPAADPAPEDDSVVPVGVAAGAG